MKKEKCQNQASLTNAYSLFAYAIRSQLTRDYYLRRLRTFFDFIKLLPNSKIEQRCNHFAATAIKDPDWTFGKIIGFLQFQKEKVEREEITAATLYNFVKALKLFCEMSDIPVSWKKITRGLPRVRSFADDRVPTIDEIRKMIEYPDRRIKAIVHTMASSGIRLGAWDYLRWKDIDPIMKDGHIVSAKVTIYAGTEEQYFSFITPEAFYELEKWVNYRKEAGEVIDKNTWVMRQLWNTKEGYYHGIVTEPIKLKSSGIKRLIERLIADIDFKLIGAIKKVNHNTARFWDEIIKRVNKLAEIKKLDIRYSSLFELHNISMDSRKSLNKLRKEVLE